MPSREEAGKMVPLARERAMPPGVWQGGLSTAWSHNYAIKGRDWADGAAYRGDSYAAKKMAGVAAMRHVVTAMSLSEGGGWIVLLF